MVDDRYEWVWLYAAIEPTTGASVFFLLPRIAGDCLQVFLEHMDQELQGEKARIVLDNAPSHHSKQVQWPQHLAPWYLPAYSPELNPAEQVFREIRKRLANTIFEDLDALREALIQELQRFWQTPSILISLTGYPWWVQSLRSS